MHNACLREKVDHRVIIDLSMRSTEEFLAMNYSTILARGSTLLYGSNFVTIYDHLKL